MLCAPASDAAVYSDGLIIANGLIGENSNVCTVDNTYAGNINVPVTENTGPVSNSYSSHTVGTNAHNSDDTQTMNLSDVTTVELTSSGNNIAAMRLSSTGSVRTTSSKATTACALFGFIRNRAEFSFAVITPGYLNATFEESGPTYVEMEIYGDSEVNDDVYVDLAAAYTKTSDTQSVYLPVGNYSGYYFSQPYRSTQSSGLNEGNTTSQFNATFTPDGTPDGTVVPSTPTAAIDYRVKGLQASPSVGKGMGYISLPLARSCSTGTLTENVTASRKAAGRIAKIDVYVDGVKTRTVKNVKPGQAITVPFADDGRVHVVKSVVTTAKTKHHPRQHTFNASSTYNTCS